MSACRLSNVTKGSMPNLWTNFIFAVKKRQISLQVTLFCGTLLLAVLCVLMLQNAREKHTCGAISNLQKVISEQTQKWRTFQNICYNGYCGPWIEEFYMTEFFKNSTKCRTRVFLPISWTNCHLYCSKEEKIAIQTFINTLDRDIKYYTVLQIDNGFDHPGLQLSIPTGLDLEIFSAGGYTKSSKAINIPIPLLKREERPIGIEKTIFMSFVGSTQTHSTREDMVRQLNESALFFNSIPNWNSIIEKSYFSLCPRGYGLTSFRLSEAIGLLSVPIYIWDEDGPMLPFQDLIDWNRFSVIVHRKDMHQILQILGNIKYSEYLGELKRVSPLFTYGFTSAYIDERVSSTK